MNLNIKKIDMSDKLRDLVIKISKEAIKNVNIDSDTKIAKYIKQKLDQEKVKSGNWNCIVGTEFGSYVSHFKGHFIYFDIGSISIFLFMI